MMMDHNDNHHPHPRDPADWLTDGATLGLIAALIQMIAGAGFDSIQVLPSLKDDGNDDDDDDGDAVCENQ